MGFKFRFKDFYSNLLLKILIYCVTKQQCSSKLKLQQAKLFFKFARYDKSYTVFY